MKNAKLLRLLRSNFIVLCLFLSSCIKRQPSQQTIEVDQAEIDRQKEMLDDIIRQEAMLVDIPVPLYDERIVKTTSLIRQNSTENLLERGPHSAQSKEWGLDTVFFGYKSPLSCTQAHDFFMTQMERYGWQHLVSFETADLLLQFASPYRYCTIIIKKSDDNSAHSRIFIYIKKSEHEARP